MPHPLDSFFAPKAIALIGASRDKEKIPGRLLSMLRKNEYPGAIYPINPNYGDIDGLKCYRAIAEIGAPVDLAVIIIPARAVVGSLEECAAAGVTTVLDALCVGDLGFETDRIRTFQEGVIDLDTLTAAGLLKADHFLHLRCEVPADDVLALFDPVADHPLVRMISLMDHSPGVGQYANLDFYRGLRRRDGMVGASRRQCRRHRAYAGFGRRLIVRDPAGEKPRCSRRCNHDECAEVGAAEGAGRMGGR